MTVLVDGEIVLYGFVGDNFWDEGFTAMEVITALAELGRDTDITVRINSGGGYTDDGIAIYNALSAHRGNVDVVVDAVAYSCGSLIAMAGDKVTMREGAGMMVHGPSGGVWGKARDIKTYADHVEALGGMMAAIYADRTGEDRDDLIAEMEREIWMTGEEAVNRGFADEVVAEKAAPVAAYDFRQYQNAPDRLVALAKRKDWTFGPGKKKAAAAAPPKKPEKEKPKMGTGKEAEAPADGQEQETATASEVKARIKAITGHDAAKDQPNLANMLAFDTDTAVDEAIATLEAARADKSSAATDDGTDPGDYKKSRSAASDLAQPDGGGKETSTRKRQIDTSAIYERRTTRKGA